METLCSQKPITIAMRHRRAKIKSKVTIDYGFAENKIQKQA
jgi:hypothetical protein